MRLPLDTHVPFWAVLNDTRLTESQARAISEAELYLSAASVWEIGIKRAIGKLDVHEQLFDIAVDAGCRPPPRITWIHAEVAAMLPLYHTDPFDRMLIAQARCEGLRLASSDAKLSVYDVSLVG